MVRLCLALALVSAAMLLSACRAAPRDSAGLDQAAALGANGDSQAVWIRRGVPETDAWPRPRVVITNFAVEFVTVKMEGPFKSQPLAGGPVMPTAAALELSGLGRRQIEYPEAVLTGAPDALLAAFEQKLRDRGFDVAAPGVLEKAPAYQRFITVDAHKSPVMGALNLVSSDTGRVKRTQTRTPRDRALVTGTRSGEAQRDVRLSILEELGGDLALSVRLRVGVFAGRATIERTSAIRVDAPSLAGSVDAQRSVLSDDAVTQSKRFEPIGGDRYTLDADAFLRELDELADVYLDLALGTRARRF